MKTINIKNDGNEALHLYDMNEIATKITINGKVMTVKGVSKMKNITLTLNPEMLKVIIQDVSNKVTATIAILNQLQNKLSGGL